MTTLTPAPLDKKGREGFYVKEENGVYWICFQYGSVNLYHCCSITKEFYQDFIKEAGRQSDKYEKILENIHKPE